MFTPQLQLSFPVTVHQDNTTNASQLAPTVPSIPSTLNVTTPAVVLEQALGAFAAGLYIFDGVKWNFALPMSAVSAALLSNDMIDVYFLTSATIVVRASSIVYHGGALVSSNSMTPSASVYAVLTPSSALVSDRLLTSAVPMVLPSSGSMANNGAITLTTALAVTYGNGAWMYLPASAIATGSAAGWYWVVMSSTTVGVVYNNTYTAGGSLKPPTTLVPFVTTGPGAYTQVTTAVNAASVTVVPNSMGANGQLNYDATFSNNNTAGAKSFAALFGGTSFWTGSETTTTLYAVKGGIANRGLTNSNCSLIAATTGGTGGATQAQVAGAVDTTASQTFAISMTLAVATDYMVLEAVKVVMNYAA